MAGTPGEVTLLLAEMNLGHRDALTRLIPLVYREVRRHAGGYLREERIGHALQPTALVPEAFLRLSGQHRANWRNRSEFMGVAAQLMRRILVDYARRRRGGQSRSGSVRGEHRPQSLELVLIVDEVLGMLEEVDLQQARVVELRYFGALSVEETAEVPGISPRTVKREWHLAKARLRDRLASEGSR